MWQFNENKLLLDDLEFEFIYIIQNREFIKSKEPIYKLGRTFKPKQILSSYPKGSRIYLILPCLDSIKEDKMVIDLFNDKFIKRKNIFRIIDRS